MGKKQREREREKSENDLSGIWKPGCFRERVVEFSLAETKKLLVLCLDLVTQD